MTKKKVGRPKKEVSVTKDRIKLIINSINVGYDIGYKKGVKDGIWKAIENVILGMLFGGIVIGLYQLVLIIIN